jgi:hypothetical protein
LPAEWRTRDRTRAPEWPALDDLGTWEALGAAHALQLLSPSFSTQTTATPPPYQVAYATGYIATMRGHIMPDQHLPAPRTRGDAVTSSANEYAIHEDALVSFMSGGDLGGMHPRQIALVLVALHKKYDLDPLSKAWIVVDNKAYPTAILATAVRRRDGLAVKVISETEVERCGALMLEIESECGPARIVGERHRLRQIAKKAGDDFPDLPGEDQVEATTTYLPLMVERVDEWGESKTGKRFPQKKSWNTPNPSELANLLMKGRTKSLRRTTLNYAGLGSSSAEDVPGEPMVIEQIEDGDDLGTIERPHPDEAGA